MAVNPNDFLDEIVTLIKSAVDYPTTWSEVYAYRTAPELYKRYIIVTYMGAETQHGTQVTGRSTTPGMDYLVVMFAQHDKSETSKETAERDLNQAEFEILKTVVDSRDNSWLKAIVPYPTTRPRQPREMPETRLAEIPLRLFT